MRLLAIFAVLSAAAFAASSAEVVMCYFEAWARDYPGNGRFEIENIDPFLCTHVMYAFATLNPNTNRVEPSDWGFDIDQGGYRRFNALKEANPNLKTMLSVGGWGDGSYKYSQMASTAEGRTAFVESCVAIVVDNGFSGLDLDWEYPGGRGGDEPGLPNDRENYAALLRELRSWFNPDYYEITAAVSASGGVIDAGYDIPAMAESLNYIGLMTYDFHGWWQGHEFTGHNSPLDAIPEEADPNHPGHNANSHWAVQRFIDGGARPGQLLLGLAAYGRGYILANPDNWWLYAGAVGPIPPERYTQAEGYWGYNEFCERLYVDGQLDQWTVVRDSNVVAPYAHNWDLWLGYDDPESIEAKSQFAQRMGLGGVMFWAMDTDDFHGACGMGAYPLINAAKRTLNP